MRQWWTLERFAWVAAVGWLAALLVTPHGPRWGDVIDVTAYPLGWSVCVKGHLQSGCYSVDREVYDRCFVGDYWELDHCEVRADRPDSLPGSKGRR